MFTGPNIVKDGLVFGYDTGYPIVSGNSDTYRFNLGEPTQNLNADPLHSTRTDGETITLANWGGDTGYGEFKVNTSPVGGGMMFINHNTSNPEGSGGTYTDFPSTRYTLENGKTYTRSWYAKATKTQSISGHVCSCNRDSDNTYIVGGSITVTPEWQRFSHTFTYSGPTSSDWQFRHIIYSNNSVFIANVQLEEGSKPTPFTTGTRSATQSLIDLKESTNIDLSNVSFGSDGLPTFDGTDDYVDLGSDITFKTAGGWTVESVVKYNSVAGGYNNVTSPANFIGADSIAYNSWYWSVLNNKLALWNISPGVWKYGSTTLQANKWYHVVLVSYNSGTSYQMYLNGVAEGGDHTTYSWNASYSGLKVRYIGAGKSTLRYTNGSIPVTKIYNRALTAQEIQQNFKAYKNRFNI